MWYCVLLLASAVFEKSLHGLRLLFLSHSKDGKHLIWREQNWHNFGLISKLCKFFYFHVVWLVLDIDRNVDFALHTIKFEHVFQKALIFTKNCKNGLALKKFI